MTIPRNFYHQSIVEFVKDKLDCGYENYESLPQSDKEDLVAIYMTVTGEDAAETVILGDDVMEVFKHFHKFIKTGDMDNGYELLNAMRNNATNSISYYMDELFSEIKGDRQIVEFKEAGLKKHVNQINGEVTWLR